MYKNTPLKSKRCDFYSTFITKTGQDSSASCADFCADSGISESIDIAFPSSCISKTSGQIDAQSVQPIQPFLSTYAFIKNHLAFSLVREVYFYSSVAFTTLSFLE